MKALLAALWVSAACAQDLTVLLGRLSEEAEVYRRMAPQAIAEETLEQRASIPSRRTGKVRLQTREIVSEYSVGALKEAPERLHEFRQVLSVDGRRLAKPEKARRTLSLGLASPDDRLRKRMLEEFQAHGLAGAAVDFGPLILLFTKRQIGNYRFSLSGAARVGADEAVVLDYRQAAGDQNLTVFAGRNTIRQPLAGQVLLRKADGLPLRITMRAARTENGHTFVEEGVVDYVMTAHGFVAPATVLHRSIADGQLAAEDRFRYATFRRFSADAEIKFNEVPEVK